MIEAGGMALAAVAPPAEGPPTSQPRAADRGGEPFERAMARALGAEKSGSGPPSASAEEAPEATDEEPPTDETATNALVAVAPVLAVAIEALITPQTTQPVRLSEAGQQQSSMMATVSDVIASFEAPVPGLAKPEAQLGTTAAATAAVAPGVAPEADVAATGVAIDGLESVQPETNEAVADVALDALAVAAANIADGAEAAAPRGLADATAVLAKADTATTAAQIDGAIALADAGESGASDGASTDDAGGDAAEQPSAGIETAAPRGADAGPSNTAQPIDATAASSVGRSTDVASPSATSEVASVARPVDTSNAPQLASRLADTVQAAVRTGEHSMRLVLNPPDMGQLDIRVVERPDGVSVSLAAGSSDARDLLQQHLPALRAALEARDVRVDRLDVTQGGSTASLGTENDQPRGGRDQQSGERPAWSLAAAIDGRAAGVGPRRAPATGSRLVDLVA